MSPLSVISAAPLVALALAACGQCEQSATFPSRWLPSPWPGYHGSGETLTAGTAYGVATGMTLEQAKSSLNAAHLFRLRAVFCGLPGATSLQPDLSVPVAAEGNPDTACPSGDTIDEVWRADPSPLCGVCQSEILDLFVADSRVRRIKFHGSGCIIG